MVEQIHHSNIRGTPIGPLSRPSSSWMKVDASLFRRSISCEQQMFVADHNARKSSDAINADAQP